MRECGLPAMRSMRASAVVMPVMPTVIFAVMAMVAIGSPVAAVVVIIGRTGAAVIILVGGWSIITSTIDDHRASAIIAFIGKIDGSGLGRERARAQQPGHQQHLHRTFHYKSPLYAV